LALVVAAALGPLTVGAIALRFESRAREAILQASSRDVASRLAAGPTNAIAKRLATDIAVLSAPVLVGVAIAVAVGSLVQGGGFAGGRRTRAHPSALDRLGAVLSRARLFTIVRAFLGGAFVTWVVTRELRLHAGDLARTSGRLGFAAPTAAALVSSVGWTIASGGLFLATVDILVTRTLWRARLRMSRDDVRRERKEAEADPRLKRAREEEREEARTRGVLEDVRLARIVVWDGRSTACALRYEDGDRAPIVVVTGVGDVGEGIVRRARELGISLHGDAGVARALGELAAGEPIPERLYDAVAELLRT
jgi:flagellar biosynthesis protein FlhB